MQFDQDQDQISPITTIRNFEKLLNSPKYQDLQKLFNWNVGKFVKLMKLDQMGFDISIFNDETFMKMTDPLDLVEYSLENNYLKPVEQGSITKVPFAEDGVHGVRTYNDKGELIETELEMDSEPSGSEEEEDEEEEDSEHFDQEVQLKLNEPQAPKQFPKMIEAAERLAEAKKKAK